MDRRVHRLAWQRSHSHLTLLQLQMLEKFISQTQILDVSRNHMHSKNKPHHPGPRGSGELGEDHHSQQFHLAG